MRGPLPPDAYPDRYRHEPTAFELAARDDPLGVPDEVALDIEGWTETDDAPIKRALDMAGWSSDQIAVLGRLVSTCQAAGCYYSGVLVPVHEDRWRLRLTLIEESR